MLVVNPATAIRNQRPPGFGELTLCFRRLVARGASKVDSYPEELDDHVKLYGVRADEFRYTNELCPICNNRIDGLGWRGHDNIGGD